MECPIITTLLFMSYYYSILLMLLSSLRVLSHGSHACPVSKHEILAYLCFMSCSARPAFPLRLFMPSFLGLAMHLCCCVGHSWLTGQGSIRPASALAGWGLG
jgi:hypothetical protein